MSEEEKHADFLASIENGDLFDVKEPMELVYFVCTKCGDVDDVPAYLIGEFMVDKKPGEPVVLECPKCNGAMYEAKDDPNE